MADISMCSGKGCNKTSSCYRYTAKKSYYQSFFAEPTINKDGLCEYFWNNKNI